MEWEKQIPKFYKNYLAKPDETLYEHTRSLLEKLKEIDEVANLDDIELVALSCIYHDIGKINPLFQERVGSQEKTKFDPEKEVGHNILSSVIAYEYLLKCGCENIDIVLNAILNHHNYTDNFIELQDNVELIVKNLEAIDGDIIDSSKKNKKLVKSTRKAVEHLYENDTTRDILVKGFLYKCDYSASAKKIVEIQDNDLNKRLELFFDQNNIKLNDMQKFSRDNADKNLLLVGSTGLGKTEASLLWAGDNKCFYVLPLKTAINAMYERIRRDFYDGDYRQHVGLLHGDIKSVYVQDINNDSNHVDEFWNYFDITRDLALPMTVTTPDQIFRFAFKYPAYELSLATYSYSKIIIDEIQAYSPDIMATIIYGISKIHSVGGKFAITTATFPPFIKDLLIESTGGEDFAEGEFLNNTVRHNVELRDRVIDGGEIAEFIKEYDGFESMKVLVVANTIKKAQELYDILNEDFKGYVKLLHSKFTMADRREKELEILKDGESGCKKKIIWVATQVVEASLDIDFDYLFTELSDLSALFQRMGRCNRKGKKDILAKNIFVYTRINEKLFRKNSERNAHSKGGFIFQSLFELSKDALSEWSKFNQNGMMSEVDKNNMINRFFTTEKLKEYEKKFRFGSYLDEYKKSYQFISNLKVGEFKFDDAKREFRNILSVTVIPRSVLDEKREEIEKNIDEINELVKKIKREKNANEKAKLKLREIRFRDEVMKYTLSVEVNRYGCEQLSVGYEKIYIFDMGYTKEKGLYNEEVDELGIFI